MAGGERGMAAQIDLAGRREPAQVVIGIVAPAWDREGGFAKIILGGDGLHQRIVEPAIQRHHRSRVAGQRPLGEGVDLEEGQGGQLAFSVISWGSRVSRSVCPSGSTWIRISVPGKRSCSASSTASSRSWAFCTVQSAGTQTWNWTKRDVPLLRVRRSCRPASSGYSTAAARNP